MGLFSTMALWKAAPGSFWIRQGGDKFISFTCLTLGQVAMLSRLSEKVKACYQRAAESERRAKEQTDPELRQDFLDAATRWRRLARSFELYERVNRFVSSRPTKAKFHFTSVHNIKPILCSRCGEIARIIRRTPDGDQEIWAFQCDDGHITEITGQG